MATLGSLSVGDVMNYSIVAAGGHLQRASIRNGMTRSSLSSGLNLGSDAIADIIADAMRAVVTRGTATAAAVSGLKVCGKTGSAQVTGQEQTNAWFIGFLDEPDLPFALCVVVEDGGGGGQAAAPLAAKIFNELKKYRY